MDSVSGFIYTHFDCPACGEALEQEGDFTGFTECEMCGELFIVE
jgi:predicted RNA-binding Zn-ribbon protein involved in translation (DUF1610 family)